MSITSIGANFGAPSQLKQLFEKRREDFDSMASAIKSGDMQGAQQALSSLQQDQQALHAALPPQLQGNSASSTSSTTPGVSTNPLASDVATLLQDVQSGDVAGSQAALQQLYQDRGQQITNAAQSTASTIQQDLSALSTDLQDGNTTQAPADLTTLQNDLKAHGLGHHHHHDADAADSSTGSSSSPTSSDGNGTNQTSQSDGDWFARSQLFAAISAYLGQNNTNTTTNTQPSSGVVA